MELVHAITDILLIDRILKWDTYVYKQQFLTTKFNHVILVTIGIIKLEALLKKLALVLITELVTAPKETTYLSGLKLPKPKDFALWLLSCNVDITMLKRMVTNPISTMLLLPPTVINV